ncbi:MAG: enoyl-CoA hydratase/isomerase family protein [Proteobacteria bacterium]|nr:enoyl-CoA hydratase/isomerase family protein [Pseudomonadota bacterium]MDA1355429.1 enoyl-CoA hydratase/isomerase family protein [Pseudomonadota bacterium]
MTGDCETMIYQKEGRRARITFNRPHILNAVAMRGAREFDRLAAEISNDKDIRIVTIAGAGRAFSTGIDLKDLAAGLIDHSYFDLWDCALRRFETMDKLVICLIHGYALGGGLQLALAADIRVSTPSAKLGLPAIKEGLIPGLGTLRLARYIGLGRAKRMIITGDMIDATEGERIGLIDYLVAEDNAAAEFEDIVERVSAANSEGCRLSKKLLENCFDLDFESFFSLYKECQTEATSSDDFREAMTAYREKRPPNWS